MFEYTIWGVVAGVIFASVFFIIRSRIATKYYDRVVDTLQTKLISARHMIEEQSDQLVSLSKELDGLKSNSGDRLQQPIPSKAPKSGDGTQSSGKRKGNSRSRSNPAPRTKPKSASRHPKSK